MKNFLFLFLIATASLSANAKDNETKEMLITVTLDNCRVVNWKETSRKVWEKFTIYEVTIIKSNGSEKVVDVYFVPKSYSSSDWGYKINSSILGGDSIGHDKSSAERKLLNIYCN